MGKLFNEGETKDRPGVYRRSTSNQSVNVAGATDGVCAVAFAADWGPLGVVTVHEPASLVENVYGTGGTVKKSASRLVEGGAAVIYAYRMGTGGKQATLNLTDSSDGVCVKLTQKYVCAKALSVTVRAKLGDASYKEFIAYDGAKELERLTFAAGEGESDALVDVITRRSSYFLAEKGASSTGIIEAVTQQAATGGQDPAVTNEDYSAAFTAFEPFMHKINTICVDTDSTAVHALLASYLDRVYEAGGTMMGVIGEPTSVTLDDRMDHAAAFNDEKIIYVGGAYKDASGNTVEGAEAAALVSAIIASTPSKGSVVHYVIPGAVDLAESITDAKYSEAIRKGMLLFSASASGNIWIDSGVNTLISPSADQDDGWKKIKRTKTRFELYRRIDATLDPLSGKINCNPDGVANVISVAKDVIDAMVTEEKLAAASTIYEDPKNAYKGDSAWFVLEVYDFDTLEKIYTTYVHNFNAEA